MPFDWKNFLDISCFIRDQIHQGAFPSPEAAFRCAIGRAYYAAFGFAHHYSTTWLGFRPKNKWEDKSQEHGALRAHLKTSKRKGVAEKLEILRSQRNLCDYEDDLPDFDFSENLAAAIAAANYVFQSLIPPAQRNP